jgi:hypothetical protein
VISWLKLDDKPIEYSVLSLLTSMVMYGLLVRVVGAPSNFLIDAIAFFLGISLAAAIGGLVWAAEEDFTSK